MQKLPTSLYLKIKFLVIPLVLAVFVFVLFSIFNTPTYAVEAPTATPVLPAATATPVPGAGAPSVSADGKWVDDS